MMIDEVGLAREEWKVQGRGAKGRSKGGGQGRGQVSGGRAGGQAPLPGPSAGGVCLMSGN